MRKFILFLLLPFLAACAGAAYEPDILGQPDNPGQFAADVTFCQKAASNWKPKASVGEVAQATIAGGTGALSYAPINPLIPALGAAGGLVGSAAQGFDVGGQSRRNVERHCLEEKTRRDGSAIVANPGN